MSAKAMESAAQIAAQTLKDAPQGAQYYKRAGTSHSGVELHGNINLLSAELFQLNNSGDRAIEMLEKAAKTLEAAGNFEEASTYFLEACTLYEDENRGILAVETFKKTVGILLKAKKSEQAVSLTHRLSDILVKIQNKHLLHKNYLCAIILVLHFGDPVEANKRYQQYTGCVMHGGFVSWAHLSFLLVAFLSEMPVSYDQTRVKLRTCCSKRTRSGMQRF